MPEEVTPEILEVNWINAPSEWRMWAIDQARQLVDVSSNITLVVEDVMQGAQLILWEACRMPKAVDASGISASEPLKAWKRDRGLV